MVLTNLFVYFRERFPIGGVALISISFALFALGLREASFDQHWLSLLALISIVFAAFLLRQRVTDEFKDKQHDDKYFSNRPFQRGVIDAKTLILLGIFALVIEILAVVSIAGINSLVAYVPVLIYSVLLAKEFFATRWLDEHFTIYFLLHEVIFVCFGVWLFSVVNVPSDMKALVWLVAFSSAMMSVEIARKFELRKDGEGRVVKDTYLAVWGRPNTLTTLGLLLVTAGIALSYVESSLFFATVSSIAALCLNLFTMSDKHVKTVVAIHLVILVVAGVLI